MIMRGELLEESKSLLLLLMFCWMLPTHVCMITQFVGVSFEPLVDFAMYVTNYDF
jgi:hypothetical protein